MPVNSKFIRFRTTYSRLFNRESAATKSLALEDELAYQIYLDVRSRTMTDANRIHNLIIATRYIVENRIQGDVIECGVWRGGSMMAIAKTLLENQEIGRELFLYDTFLGMTQPIFEDVDLAGNKALELMQRESNSKQGEYRDGVIAYASLGDVKAGMQTTGYKMEQVNCVQGDVLETLLLSNHEQIALLRLDTDWYESTKLELEILWPKITKGGVMIIDDYDYWSGCRKAVDEYFTQIGVKPLMMKMSTGRIILKIT